MTKQKVAIDLASGSLLIMKGTCQHHWVHALPKTKKVIQARINLTFRTIF
ncbi:MAG: alpha-ketoglutarate-dependent dioxygenase AlkB [Flavobacteriaceae bacterium]|nr:alpha-ketoglutarate-dependent dioxygenase AlkB [Flavobacteriaceae bacterium]